MRPRIAMAAVVCGLVARWAFCQNLGWLNLDFEAGNEPWGVWYSDDRNYSGPRFEYGPDTSVAKSGHASMRIIATSRDAGAFVNQTTDKFKPGARYELSYWLKVSAPEMAKTCAVLINLRKPRPGGKGLTMRGIRPTTFSTVGPDGWIRRRTCFDVDPDTKLMQIGLSVRQTVGTAWFDDVRIKEWVERQISVDSMYDYYPLQVKLGRYMVKRFRKLADAKSPFLDRAKVYNQLLVDVARATEDARRLQRCQDYLDALGKPANALDAAALATDLEKQLDQVYKTYGRLFANKNTDGLAEFDAAAQALSQRVQSARTTLAQRIRALQAAAKQAGQTWTVPPVSQPKPVVISPDGKLNQIVFARSSPGAHFELEAPLDLGTIGSVSSRYDMGKLTDPNQPYKFEVTKMLWGRIKNCGAEQASIFTGLAVGGAQMTPAWFVSKLKDDPDLLLCGADGAKAKVRRGYALPLNTWRPEVRKMTVDLATQLARTFKPRKEFLFYVTANENLGPYFGAAKGPRSTGYNASALPDFHASLKARYGDVGELNRQWRTTYARIDGIQPPPDPCIVGEWQRPHPLGYEFQSWRNDHHVAWLKLIYDTLKKTDPAKPVFASHSTLLRSQDGSRLFDTVDIMGFHSSAPTFMLGTVYIYSLNRFAHKQLGQYECFWGIQEDHPRLGEERVQRAAMSKYLYRLTTWGMHVQVWWYAYTSANYLLKYNGNWFNPVYDLTTLRYCAAALPVGKAKVKRLEDVFLNAPIVRSRVVMVQPNTSMLFQRYARGQSFLEMIKLHQTLFARNDLYELIPETYFADGRASLDDFDVVILPYAPFFPDKLASMLRAWVEKGGLLVAAGPFGLYDKFGFDKPDLWRAAFGGRMPKRLTTAKETAWRWSLTGEAGEPALVEAALGNGKVMLTLQSLNERSVRDAVAPRIVAAIEAKARRAATCSTNDFEMSVLESADRARYLSVLNRNVDQRVRDEVVLSGAYKRGVDLDVPGGFPVRFDVAGGQTHFALSLAPGEFTVIALEQ